MAKSKKKIGRPRVLTEAQREARKDAARARIQEWHELHRRDPEYRAQERQRARERAEQLKADAELGRMARAFLQHLGEMIIEIATPRPFLASEVEKKSREELMGLKPSRRPMTPQQADAWAKKHLDKED